MPAGDYFRLLIEGVQDFAIVTLNTEGYYDSWNSGAERLLGYSETEALGKPTGIIFTPEDRAKGVPQQEQETARREGRAEDERWHQRKDGSLFWGSGVMSPIRDEAGVLIGYSKIFRDLTERKQLEEALLAANDALERRVEERTAELRTAHDLRRGVLQRLVTAQEDERRHLSRELHDQMGQQITGLLLGIASLRTLSLPQEAVTALVPLESLVREIAEEVHRVAVALRPTALDDLGLLPALRNYVSQWADRNAIPVDMEVLGWDNPEPTIEERGRLPRDVETTIYRITQEVLTNVSRHAREATRISLVLQRKPEEVRVILEDDGTGFDVEAVMNQPVEKRRLGLFGMQERAMLVGGAVTIESEPGNGTSVFLQIPLPGVETP